MYNSSNHFESIYLLIKKYYYLKRLEKLKYDLHFLWNLLTFISSDYLGLAKANLLRKLNMRWISLFPILSWFNIYLQDRFVYTIFN